MLILAEKMNQLYRERLVEIYANKKHFGNLERATHKSLMKNPLCDDEIVVELKVENGKIINARFHGKACFVSMISAEVLMENIIGMKIEELVDLRKEDIDKFLGTEVVSTRTGCEVFPLDVLKSIHAIEEVSED